MKKKGNSYRQYWFELGNFPPPVNRSDCVDSLNDEICYYTNDPSLGALKSTLKGKIPLDIAKVEGGLTAKKQPKISMKTSKGKKYDD